MGLLDPDPGHVVVLSTNSEFMLPGFGSQQLVGLLVKAPHVVHQLRPLAEPEFSGPPCLVIIKGVLGIKQPETNNTHQRPMYVAGMMLPSNSAQVNWTNAWGSFSVPSLPAVGGVGDRWNMATTTQYMHETKDWRE